MVINMIKAGVAYVMDGISNFEIKPMAKHGSGATKIVMVIMSFVAAIIIDQLAANITFTMALMNTIKEYIPLGALVGGLYLSFKVG